MAHDVWMFPWAFLQISSPPFPTMIGALGGCPGHLEGFPPSLASVWLGQWEAESRMRGSESEVRVIYSLASSLRGL